MRSSLDPFQVTWMLGMNAFWILGAVHKTWEKKRAAEQRIADEDSERRALNCFEDIMHVAGNEDVITQNLAGAVIQYQASMEAILSNAVARSPAVAAVATTEKFARDWRAALREVGESTKEFDVYHDHFYKELRIPLTHLHGNTQEKLRKINAMDFPEVYNGVRHGWWAHIRLLRGMGIGTGSSIQENWEHICEGAPLPPDLFPDSHPDNLPEP